MKVLQSDAPLIVYVDVKSPYAFVAIRPTLALEVELGMKFDFEFKLTDEENKIRFFYRNSGTPMNSNLYKFNIDLINKCNFRILSKLRISLDFCC